MHIVFAILICIIKLTVEPTVVKNCRTFRVSIAEQQARYKRSFRMETRTQGQKNPLSVICIYIYIYTLWTANNALVFALFFS